MSEGEVSGLNQKKDDDSGSIKNKIIDVISKAEKEVDKEDGGSSFGGKKLFDGEELNGISKEKQKGTKKNDLSHRGRRDYDDEFDHDTDIDGDNDGGLDSTTTEEKVIRKANEAINKNK
jgi:hypothetical protein